MLWLASAILPVLIIGRIIHQRLYAPPFDAFVLMLGVVIGRDVVLASLHYDSHPYIIVWEFSLPVVLVSQIYAGLQTLIAVARLYPRFGAFTVRLFLACLTLTVACCCLGLPFELHRLGGEEAFLRSFFLAQRWVDSSIAGTLILTSLFLMRRPAPPRQPSANLILHTTLLSVYFTGYAALFFFENLVPLGAMQVMERVQFSLVVLLYAIWTIRLSLKRQRTGLWTEVDAILLRKVNSGTHSNVPAMHN